MRLTSYLLTLQYHFCELFLYQGEPEQIQKPDSDHHQRGTYLYEKYLFPLMLSDVLHQIQVH